MSRNNPPSNAPDKKNVAQKNTRQSADSKKKARFDEDNIRDTLHPEGKDYGHMKIEEPKTPFNWADPTASNQPSTSRGSFNPNQTGIDAAALQQKLQKEIQSSSEEEKKKKEFEEKRKAHYDEYIKVRARKNSDDLEDDDSGTSLRKRRVISDTRSNNSIRVSQSRTSESFKDQGSERDNEKPVRARDSSQDIGIDLKPKKSRS